MAKVRCKAICLMTCIFFGAVAMLIATRHSYSAAAEGSGPNEEADPDDPKFAGHFSGRVTDSDGEPLRAARIYIVPIDREFNTLPAATGDAKRIRAETDADGHFEFDAPDMTYVDFDGLPARRKGFIRAAAAGYGPDWIFLEGRSQFAHRSLAQRIKRNHLAIWLAKDDVPIRGRFLNPDGHPLAGVRVRLAQIMVPRNRNLDAHLDREATLSRAASPPDGDRSFYYRPHQMPDLPAEAVTDADGRFTMSGFGRDRLVQLEVSAPGIVDTTLTVMTRGASDVGIRPNFDGVATSIIYGATFTLQLAPGRTISGVVRDRASGQPITGIEVGIGRENTLPSRAKDVIYPRDGILWHQTTTDAEGRFRITGLRPTREKRPITAVSAPGMPYQSASVFADGDAPVLIECERGIPFRLKVIDEQEQPVEAVVTYSDVTPNADAPKSYNYPCRKPLSVAARTADGSYQGFVVPGPGALLVQTPGHDDYRSAYVNPKAFFAPGRNDWTAQERITAYGTPDTLSTSCGLAIQDNYAAIVLVNPPVDSEPLELTATIVKVRPRSGRLIGPDGNPVMGVKARQMMSHQQGYEAPLRGAGFRLAHLHPDRARRIMFIQEERQLIGFLSARGGVGAPYTVRMQAWATVTGRIVDEHGQAIPIGKPGSIWEKPPTLSLSSSTEANEEAAGTVSVTIEPNGRFRVDRLVPGLRYRAEIRRGQRERHFVGMAFVKLAFRPGEARDLGDLRVKPFADVAWLKKAGRLRAVGSFR